jgi:HlyD family secretion protein
MRPSTVNSWFRRLLVWSGALALVVGLAWAWWPEPVDVEVETAAVGTVRRVRVEEGRVRALRRFTAVAPVAGVLEELSWNEGDEVVVGDTIATLRPAEAPLLDARTREETERRVHGVLHEQKRAQAAAAAAQEAAVAARREASRAADLFAGGAVSRQHRDSLASEARALEDEAAAARAGAESAQANVAVLRSVLGTPGGVGSAPLTMMAPFSGRVLRRFRDSAGWVAPGTPLLEIADLAMIEFIADFPSEDVLHMVVGAPARVAVGGEHPEVVARVHRIEPSAFTRVSALGIEEQRVNVVFQPVAATSLSLGDGYRIEAAVELDRADGVIVVPEAAVFSWGDGDAVFVVRGTRALRRPVRLGLRDGDGAEVREGLAAGDSVIVDPSDAVDDGVRVRPLKTKRPSAAGL